jgi:hypothetical protein
LELLWVKAVEFRNGLFGGGGCGFRKLSFPDEELPLEIKDLCVSRFVEKKED